MREVLALLVVLGIWATTNGHASDHPYAEKLTGPLTTFTDVGGWWRIGDHRLQCGMTNDIPVPGDYLNEGSKRIAVFRPSNGYWYIKGKGEKDWGASAGNMLLQCGMRGDVPVPGDYNGDGIVDIAVWRPSVGYWYIKGKGTSHWALSSGNIGVQCGTRGDVPVPMDYFNEGRLRLAVWRPSNGVWYIKGDNRMLHWNQSSGNIALQCGSSGDIPVPGDYFGDGIVRLAVWRPSNGVWYIKGTELVSWGSSGGNVAVQCGTQGDIPVPYDYFDEGKLRIAVYRPSTGVWYIKGDGMQNWGSSAGNVVFYKGNVDSHSKIPVHLV